MITIVELNVKLRYRCYGISVIILYLLKLLLSIELLILFNKDKIIIN